MSEERVKPLVLKMEDTGEEYTLEFSRETVKYAEGRGFNVNDLANFPMTKIPELFWYAFRMHHKNISREKTDRIIFEDWGGVASIPEGVIERLGELYLAPFSTVGGSKNSKVKIEL